MKTCLLYIVFFLCCMDAFASHIVGGDMTYQFVKSGLYNGVYCNYYEVTLTIYEDCKNGSATAIAEDDPAFIDVFDGYGNWVYLDTFNQGPNALFHTSSVTVPSNFSNNCITNPPEVCVLKKTFQTTFALPPNSSGYVVSYQRCCRNNEIVNIINPGSTGSTYFCTIPPERVGINNSAVFKNYPPLIICVNNPLNYDNSATDADGDSLSYAFCVSYTGGDESNVKPYPAPPPYGTVFYVYPFSDSVPMIGSPPIAIDPVTGMITGTPTQLGRYLISVCCVEWRHGVSIDTVRREFQFVVTNCTKTVVASIPQLSTDYNTYIVSCNSYNVFFENTSSVGTTDSTYHWNFGVPGAPGDTSDLFEPTFTYPDTGVFTVTLVVNPNTDCTDSISRFVKVFPYFNADYIDSGMLCPGDSIYYVDKTFSTMQPIISWNWNFGDGNTSTDENPVHSYDYGGIYNVELVSENIKTCIDTIVKQVLIDNFKPFAGDDTIILKGQSVYFNATGGTTFLWSPPYQLSDSAIGNPVGYYPDTGKFTYSVFVVSEFGCSGYDTVTVQVVPQTAFFVPTGFTPGKNGIDGLFRPIAIGYTSLNYFRIFDRWGEQVYFGNSLKEGEGWDGTYKNQPVQMGVYFWELSYTDIYGRTGTLKGDVTLIR